MREAAKDAQIRTLEDTKLEINQMVLAFSRDLREMMINITVLVGILEEYYHDSSDEKLRSIIDELHSRTKHTESFFQDFHNLTEQMNKSES